MKAGSVPSAWLAITDNWTAEALLRLLAEVDKRGIAHDDLKAVEVVWREIKVQR